MRVQLGTNAEAVCGATIEELEKPHHEVRKELNSFSFDEMLSVDVTIGVKTEREGKAAVREQAVAPEYPGMNKK